MNRTNRPDPLCFPRGFEQKQQEIMVDRQLGSGHEHTKG